MREIVNIQIGQCGNQIGTEFWELICMEHGLDQTGTFVDFCDFRLSRINVYFNEMKGLKYTPRSVMVDLDRQTMTDVRCSPYGEIFKPDSFLCGSDGTRNNWAKGHLTEGAALAETTLEWIRREVEACDCIHGFQLLHSIAGGTGGGLGSLLMCRMKEEYPKRLLVTYSIAPSTKVSNNILEPYNAVLSLNHLIEGSQETYCMDNEALYEIGTAKLNLEKSLFKELNQQIALVMSGITTNMRFPGPASTDFRKIAVNMIPFPRLHFFVPGFSPIVSRGCQATAKLTLSEITSDLFDGRNLFATCDSKKGKFLTAACIFRGKMSTKEVSKQLQEAQNKNSPNFVQWLPNNVKAGICNIPPPGFTTTGTFIGNTTSIQDVFERIKQQYLAMFKRKAYLHLFMNEGLEELEFESAEANLCDLISEYQESAEFEIGAVRPRELSCLSSGRPSV